MSGAAASLSSVSKTYRRRGLTRTTETAALDGVSLEIPRGEIVGLLGLNGAGKTTVMKLLTGLLFPDSGSIGVLGASPDDVEAKRRVGYLPELPYFYPYLRPAEALAYYGRLSGLSPGDLSKAVPAALERVGLAAHASKRAGEFSKGMMQRLGLAQAILHSPDLLILDEPVSGLDPLAVHEMRSIITGLNAEGRTIFLSSHSISELEKVCHRVLILKRGKVARQVLPPEWAAGGLEAIFVEQVK